MLVLTVTAGGRPPLIGANRLGMPAAKVSFRMPRGKAMERIVPWSSSCSLADFRANDNGKFKALDQASRD